MIIKNNGLEYIASTRSKNIDKTKFYVGYLVCYKNHKKLWDKTFKISRANRYLAYLDAKSELSKFEVQNVI